MALIAYLMEKKQNFGPHLIIVPNAGAWLPCGVDCINAWVQTLQGAARRALLTAARTVSHTHRHPPWRSDGELEE